MDRLWTPWRYSYVSGEDVRIRRGVPAGLESWPESERSSCVFCNMIGAVDYAIAQGMDAEDAERSAHIIYRGPQCFICLNAFPYSTGHVMIVPYRHIDSLAELNSGAAAEMMLTLQQIETTLREVYRPQGLNFGMNLGEAAGAGVAGHIHMHALPRWSGDTNFMTVTAETRILPETLDITWAKLRAVLSEHLSTGTTSVTMGASD